MNRSPFCLRPLNRRLNLFGRCNILFSEFLEPRTGFCRESRRVGALALPGRPSESHNITGALENRLSPILSYS